MLFFLDEAGHRLDDGIAEEQERLDGVVGRESRFSAHGAIPASNCLTLFEDLSAISTATNRANGEIDKLATEYTQLIELRRVVRAIPGA